MDARMKYLLNLLNNAYTISDCEKALKDIERFRASDKNKSHFSYSDITTERLTERIQKMTDSGEAHYNITQVITALEMCNGVAVKELEVLTFAKSVFERKFPSSNYMAKIKKRYKTA